MGVLAFWGVPGWFCFGYYIIFMRQLSLGLRMKFKTLFMSDEEKHGHHFDLPLFFNMSRQFLAPVGLSAEYVQANGI